MNILTKGYEKPSIDDLMTAESVEVYLMTITPSDAKTLLTYNEKNRPIAPKSSARYASIMKEKNWRLNGDTIKLGNQRLIDGQHRLTGCVNAGIPFETLVVAGLDAEVFNTLDEGRKRSGADLMAILSATYPKETSVLARRLVHPVGAPLSTNYVTNAMFEKLYNDLDPELIDRAISHGKKLYNKQCPVVPENIYIYFSYLLTLIDRPKAELFLGQIAYGENLSLGDPAYALRSVFDNNKARQIKMANKSGPEYYIYLIICAWDLFMKGKKIQPNSDYLKYKKALYTDKKYPKIKGLADHFEIIAKSGAGCIVDYEITIVN